MSEVTERLLRDIDLVLAQAEEIDRGAEAAQQRAQALRERAASLRERAQGLRRRIEAGPFAPKLE